MTKPQYAYLEEKPQYTYLEYAFSLEEAEKKHILVEGKDDETLINIFIDEFDKSLVEKIHIDKVEMIQGNPNNRIKLEETCKEALENIKPWDRRFVGFMDREFSDFSIEEPIEDITNCHKIISENLVRSRGHSVENYFFDIDITCAVLRNVLETPDFRQIIDLFRVNFNDAILIACAVGLTGYKLELLQKLRYSIKSEHLFISKKDSSLDISFDLWENSLNGSLKNSSIDSQQVISTFSCFRDRLRKIDTNIMRWMCDGHLGIKIIKGLCEACVNSLEIEFTPPSVKEDRYFHSFADAYIKSIKIHQINQRNDSVLHEVFRLLGIELC